MTPTLTRERIEKMEAGPEMDALVAERVMGWAWGPGPCLYEPDGPRRAHPRSGLNLCDPYSTDIAAAWKVAEHLAASRYLVIGSKYGEGWSVGDRPPCDSYLCLEIGSDEPREPAPAPFPLAICRAALLATL